MLSLLPSSIVSKIGQFLNHKNIIKFYSLEKDNLAPVISKFKNSVIIIEDITTYKCNLQEFIIAYWCKLNKLCSHNLKFLKLNINWDYETNGVQIVVPEIIKILKFLANFKKLTHLCLEFWIFEEANIDITEYLFDLQYLEIDFLLSNTNINILFNLPHLQYLKLNYYNPHYDTILYLFDEVKTENKLNTLDLSYIDRDDIVYNLKFFKNLRRLIIDIMDNHIIKQLMYIPNLEVLEYDYYKSHIDLDIKNNYFPKWIKYISTNFNVINSKGPIQFLEALIAVSPNLEYINITRITSVDILIDLLTCISKFKVKYLHLSEIKVNNIFIFSWNKLADILRNINTNVIFDKLYCDDKDLSMFQNIWNLEKFNNYYILKNCYSPDQWLKEHEYLLKSEFG